MFTVEAIRQRYQVTEATVLGWIKAGELRAINVGRNPGSRRPRWRISQAALDDFEAVRTTGAPVQQRKNRRRLDDGIIQFYTVRER
jgi:hypothetical protein